MQKTVTPHTAAIAAPAGLSRTALIQRLAQFSQLVFGICVLLVFIGGKAAFAVNMVPEPFDKPFHAIVFAIFVVLLAASHPRWGWHAPPYHQRHRQNHRLWLVLCTLAACALGAADEIHQLYLPGRSAGFDDWLADAFGAVLGAWAWARFVQHINR